MLISNPSYLEATFSRMPAQSSIMSRYLYGSSLAKKLLALFQVTTGGCRTSNADRGYSADFEIAQQR